MRNAYASVSAESGLMRLLVTPERDETGMTAAERPSMPRCVCQAKPEEETVADIREAVPSSGF